jgi:hypothetical protein
MASLIRDRLARLDATRGDPAERAGPLREASFGAWIAQLHASHTSPFSVMFVFEAGT